MHRILVIVLPTEAEASLKALETGKGYHTIDNSYCLERIVLLVISSCQLAFEFLCGCFGINIWYFDNAFCVVKRAVNCVFSLASRVVSRVASLASRVIGKYSDCLEFLDHLSILYNCDLL